MIKIITGQTGEGKTKKMIEAANQRVSTLKGHVVYIDSSTTHRYALSHQIRLIEASTFPLHSQNDFFGFLCGILSSNHDIETVFIDELIKITHASIDELILFFDKLKKLSDEYAIEFIVGTSCSNKDIPDILTPYLTA
jgi:thymidine kinase